MKYSLPEYYIIEITNKCNFKCPICPHSFMRKEDNGDMDIGLFERIIDQIASTAKVIQLYWMGEPLLNKDVYQMVRLCKQKTNAKVIISTNGSLLTVQSVSLLDSNGLDEIIISADASDTQDIYGAIRINGRIDELNRNIELLLRHKGKMHVVLKFIDMYINKGEREAFINKWRNADCDIIFSCLYTWANQIPSLTLASDHLSPVCKRNRVPCADLWNKLTINHKGLVSVCCFDWRLSSVLGNCAIDTLLDIWNGDIINRIREFHEEGNYHQIPLCRDCDAWAVPEEYKEMYNL